ncbi:MULTISPECIES: YceI family protein [Rhodanobacter]|uniref:YceI family protein n=1 Tax=Rhodanobacter TaxID=75309 RepID=UPI0004284AF6|nr:MULTISPECIES: YceI family protein [Rhodanobacter]KZC19287.1 polyisoprenoid-binding protein [Rhodanobacter denitrificans]UJJ51722.1 YceI family protein [Rhodanobacter denitrificans]UJM94466.1 YceI family protein [Rhodanobacter denitrificans]UJM97996.1 YceI family protein [Rhodanobacter denitrificans]UJN22590.1 YceI family protein [Rhodanobacter denitrificans]
MKRLAMLLALALPGLAAATDYTVQPASSTLGFSNTFQGESFDGRFDRWTAAISYDAANLATSKFDVEVDLASVKTGDRDRDGALPGADFFDVAKFPKAHFVTTGFRQSGGKVIADGTLTLRGVSKPMSLEVTFKPQGRGAMLDVAATLQRLDFGVGTGDYADTSVIGGDVKVTAHLQLAPK